MARRRLDGLCFNCPEKFSRDHAKQCTMRGIYFLEMDTDDAASEQDSEEDMSISMYALAGIRMGGTLNLAASIGDTNLTALIDSGSTHCFLAESTAWRIGLVPEPRPGLTVGVANGERVPATGVCKAVPITIGAETFHVDVYIILLDGCELVWGATGCAPLVPSCGISTAVPWPFGATVTESSGWDSTRPPRHSSPSPRRRTCCASSSTSSPTSSPRRRAFLPSGHSTTASIFYRLHRQSL
jgi:hypothetical protein